VNRLDNISWLEDWYEAQCDGEREHHYGVKIDTLDNPGWTVQIDLNGTRYSEIQNHDLIDDRTPDTEWIVCKLEDGKFIGHGGPKQLGRILQVFRKWIEDY
jgi:hypothetical protein